MEVQDHMPQAYARRLAQRVARYLKRRYGATKVLLFGSLAVGCYNPDFSDIDIYFEGVREGQAANVMADCKRNFRFTDSGGRLRLHFLTQEELRAGGWTQIAREAEEL